MTPHIITRELAIDYIRSGWEAEGVGPDSAIAFPPTLKAHAPLTGSELAARWAELRGRGLTEPEATKRLVREGAL